jgi:glutamate--cysteine ligase
VPEKPFEDLEDYARAIASLRPVYVKRGGMPIVLTSYNSFDEYYRSTEAAGLNLEGREVALRPEEPDIDLHCTCCWHNARLSRYCTVENRSNDQQPPGDLVCVSALTLGLVCALDECWEVVSSYRWEDLREARKAACRSALEGRAGDLSLVELAEKMVKLARRGLLSRGLGEEEFLKPLERRLRERRCPADQAVELFVGGGIRSLLAARAL